MSSPFSPPVSNAMRSTNAASKPAPAAISTFEYPSVIPVADRATLTVPNPIFSYPSWTTDDPRFKGMPRSFDSMISLPNSLTHPAYHSAAVSTIWLTNMRLAAHAPYSTQPLRKRHVEDLCKKWRAEHPNETAYPFPPDPRILYVKEDDEHPTDDWIPSLWTQACTTFLTLSPLQKDELLRLTRIQHNHYRQGNNEPMDRLYIRYFLRYLVWREHVSLKGPDLLPSAQQVRHVFAMEDVKENGATLSDIQQYFPNARDARMLVWRVERFGELRMKGDDEDGEKVESAYFPKSEKVVEEEGEEVVEVEVQNRGDASSLPPPLPSLTEVGTPTTPTLPSPKRKRASGDDGEAPKKKTRREGRDEGMKVMKCGGKTRNNTGCKRKKLCPVGQRWKCASHQ